MRIGQLRKRITIQAETSTPDGAGGYTLGWSNVGTFWADISPVTGRELFMAQHLEGRVTHKITMRWQSGVTITSDMIVLYGTRTFNIHAVLNTDEKNQWV
jgi:SPP1 family predicted phage head-tail adaptor